jgi:quinol monooxygenase YgiN
MSKVAMIAKITAAPGKRDEVTRALEAVFPHVEDEDGTELYLLHEDHSDGDVLWVYELYRDHDALQAHATSPAMGELMGALGGELVGAPPELIMLDPVRGKGYAV